MHAVVGDRAQRPVHRVTLDAVREARAAGRARRNRQDHLGVGCDDLLQRELGVARQRPALRLAGGDVLATRKRDEVAHERVGQRDERVVRSADQDQRPRRGLTRDQLLSLRLRVLHRLDRRRGVLGLVDHLADDLQRLRYVVVLLRADEQHRHTREAAREVARELRLQRGVGQHEVGILRHHQLVRGRLGPSDVGQRAHLGRVARARRTRHRGTTRRVQQLDRRGARRHDALRRLLDRHFIPEHVGHGQRIDFGRRCRGSGPGGTARRSRRRRLVIVAATGGDQRHRRHEEGEQHEGTSVHNRILSRMLPTILPRRYRVKHSAPQSVAKLPEPRRGLPMLLNANRPRRANAQPVARPNGRLPAWRAGGRVQ